MRKILHNNSGGVNTAQEALHFVREHKNVFSTSTRRYVVNSVPPVIKEIDRYKDNVRYWFWCFFPWLNKRIIYQFNHKPSKGELAEMWKDWEENGGL